jgi:peptide chain release factor subunit 3
MAEAGEVVPQVQEETNVEQDVPVEAAPQVVQESGSDASVESAPEEAPASEPSAQPESAPAPVESTPEESAPVESTAEESAVASPSSKDLVQREEDNREPVSLVFIGHVDAGKSTLAGNILFQMKEVDDRTIQKYKEAAEKLGRSSWVYAFVIDTNEEERAKGKTVEVGRAHFETPAKRYTILDAPGHKDYVPNMIGGAANADIAILVISARKGEFETGYKLGGQTQEHATLVKMLGVKKIVLVINKMDDPTVEWSKERFEEIKNELVPFMTRKNRKMQSQTQHGPSLEYSPEDLYWVPISGYSGINVVERMPAGVS